MLNRRFDLGSFVLLLTTAAIAPLTGCGHDEVVVHHRRPREEVVVEEDHYHRPPPPVIVDERPPVIVEERRPVVVDERPPVVVDRRPVVVEREPIRDRRPTERARGIPEAANMMQEGKGRVGFQSRHDGEVWIEDTHDLKVVFEGRLFDGEEVVVEAGRDRILINGREARIRGLQNDHRFRIYFLPAAGHFERYGKGHDPRFDH